MLFSIFRILVTDSGRVAPHSSGREIDELSPLISARAVRSRKKERAVSISYTHEICDRPLISCSLMVCDAFWFCALVIEALLTISKADCKLTQAFCEKLDQKLDTSPALIWASLLLGSLLTYFMCFLAFPARSDGFIRFDRLR